mmetsp:Transcript_21743/g.37061  ORF Transcript_21743/g.37061 Transcript_21743/m.37061 type:complete len:219 (+) Transcript_21743:1096-1752(+)
MWHATAAPAPSMLHATAAQAPSMLQASALHTKGCSAQVGRPGPWGSACEGLLTLGGDPLAARHTPCWFRLVTMLAAKLGLAPLLQRLDHSHTVLRGEVLVVVVAEPLHTIGVISNRNHGRIDACAHALHLTEGEQAILCRLSNVNTQVLLNGLLDFQRPLQPAWSGPADHDVVLAHLAAVEHAVECCHLIHANLGHFEQYGHTVEGCQAEESGILLLC